MTRSTLISLLALSLCAASSSAATLNVPAGYPTIQDAIDAAAAGDAVVIQPGTYFETIQIDKDITIRSADRDPTTVTIDANGASLSTVRFTGARSDDARLIGLTITGAAYLGGSGGGVYIQQGDPIIRKCIITGNEALLAAGIMSSGGAGGNPQIDQCLITDNIAAGAGGGIYFNGPGSPSMTNTTVTNNVSGVTYADIYVYNGAQLSIANSIIADNDGEHEIESAGGGAATVSYSLVEGGYSGTGNLDADPIFVDPANGDYRLAPGSPCIDAGDNAALPSNFQEDIFGGVRYRHDPHTPNTGSGAAPFIDMGAAEFVPTVRYVDIDATGTTDGLSWDDAYTDLGLAIASVYSDPGVTELWVAEGVYHPDFGTGDRYSAFIMRSGKAIYGGFVGNEFWMEDRNYDDNETILSGAIGAPNDPTDNSYHVVKAGADVDETAILDGFIIQKAYNHTTWDGAGIQCVDGASPRFQNCWIRLNDGVRGAAAFGEQASPTFVSCSINNNNGGEAIYMFGGAPAFTNCRVAGNVSPGAAGAGMHLREITGAVLTNCTIYGNESTSGSSYSGGVAAYFGDVEIYNCLIWANQSGTGTLEHSNYYDVGVTLTMRSTSFEGATYSYGHISNNGKNPEFVNLAGPNGIYGDTDDNFSLALNSPAIDSADHTLLDPTIVADLDDKIRHLDDTGMPDFAPGSYLDRGCLEFDSISCAFDLSPNGQVDVNDLLVLLGQWGADGTADRIPAGGDWVVDIYDLLGILGAWGSCEGGA